MSKGKKVYIEKVAYDGGNTNVKCCCAENYDKPIVFPARISQFRNNSELTGRDDELTIDGKTYYIGPRGEYESEFRKISKENYLNFLYAAIARTTKSEYIELRTGLPISQFQEDQETLEQLIMGNKDVDIIFNGESRTLHILSADVVPEGVYTYENDDFEGIIIDLGGGTTDVCQITHDEDGELQVIKFNSIGRGTTKLYSDYANLINSISSSAVSPDDAANYLRRGWYMDDGEEKKVDMSIVKNFIDGIVHEIRANGYSIDKEKVSITGGGGKKYFNYFKDAIGKNCTLQADPMNANVKAYFDLWSDEDDSEK